MSPEHADRLGELLADDLARLAPGCAVTVTAGRAGWTAEAVHKTTGRRMRVRVSEHGWEVSTGAGAHTTGTSAYGYDSAVTHAYRHDLDFDPEHGPGTAYAYAEHAARIAARAR